MKKEVFSAIILIIVLSLTLVNIEYINSFTAEIVSVVQFAENDASSENWADAEKKAEKASSMWHSHDSYTHVFLGHKDIDATSDAFYSFLEKIYSHDAGGAKAAADLLTHHLSDIGNMEKIKIGNIF